MRGLKQLAVEGLVADLNQVAAEAEALRRLDRDILVLTNGCYDVLHPGHIAMLQGAAAEGTRLVVAVDDDKQVAKLRASALRPLRPLADRMQMVAAVRGVWRVIPHGPATGCDMNEVMARLRPDVYVCRAQGVPWADGARAVGARVVRLGRHGAWSTTGELQGWLRRLAAGEGAGGKKRAE